MTQRAPTSSPSLPVRSVVKAIERFEFVLERMRHLEEAHESWGSGRWTAFRCPRDPKISDHEQRKIREKMDRLGRAATVALRETLFLAVEWWGNEDDRGLLLDFLTNWNIDSFDVDGLVARTLARGLAAAAAESLASRNLVAAGALTASGGIGADLLPSNPLWSRRLPWKVIAPKLDVCDPRTVRQMAKRGEIELDDLGRTGARVRIDTLPQRLRERFRADNAA
jgi:hypothetical protein